MKKWLIIFGLVLGCTAIGVVWQLNKSHRDIAKEPVVATISATELFQSFQVNEADANALYLDRTIAVTGTIIEKGTNQDSLPYVVLQTADDFFGVNAHFDDVHALDHYVVNSEIKVKGQCTGMAMDVTLIHCAVIPK